MPKVTRGFYAVAKGRQIGVYETWDDCETQVKGFLGAKYKKFPLKADAEAFVASTSTGVAAAATVSPDKPTSSGSPSGKRATPYTRPEPSPAAQLVSSSKLPPQSSSLFTPKAPPRIVSPRPQRGVPMKIIPWTQRANSPDIKPEDERLWDIVYSDGACKNNGKPNAIAGVGVWFGHNDPKNVSERCPGDQTNNRAELLAIIRVLEKAPPTGRLLIKTDSQYSIKCMKEYFPAWRSRGWRKSDGTPVKNPGLIRYLASLLDKRASQGENVRLQYIKAHVGHEGNEGADQLAGAGTSFPAVPELPWDEFEQKVRADLKKMETADEDKGTIAFEEPLDLNFYAEGLTDEAELAKELGLYADALVDDDQLWRELEEA